MLDMNDKRLINLKPPCLIVDAATKQWVTSTEQYECNQILTSRVWPDWDVYETDGERTTVMQKLKLEKKW